MADLIQIRRDTRANWASANPKLAIGEVGIITDNNTPGNTGSLSFKVGDGTNLWNQMPEQVLIGPDTLENISASIAAVQTGSAADLVEVSQSLNNRITSVSSSLSSSIVSVDSRLTTVSGSLDTRINSVSSSLDTKINNVSSSLDTTISSSSAEINDRIDGVEQDIQDNYARQDGYYSTLTAGAAENLVGQTVDSEAYLIRPTGGESNEVANGVASVLGMEGNSVVWNQLVAISAIPSTRTIKGITITNNGDGTITCNGTTTENWWANYEIQTVARNTSHKYLLKGVPKGFGTNICLHPAGSPSGDDFGNGAIFYGSTGISYFALNFKGSTSNPFTVENVVVKPQLYDLTLMFGAGNEPATVAEFEAWLAQHVGTKPYYAYNAGTILSAQTLGIKTYGQNLLNPTTRQAKLIPYTWEENSNVYTIKNVPSGATATFTPDNTGVAVSVDINGGSLDITSYGSGILELSAATADTYVCMKWDEQKDDDVVPFEDHTYDFDVRKVYGKVNGAGEYTQCYPNGMRSAGSVRDSLTASEAVVNIGSVDLGSLSWYGPSDISGGYKRFITEVPKMKSISLSSTMPFNAICPRYVAVSRFNLSDKVIYNFNDSISNQLNVIDMDYASSTAVQYKAAMNGVILYYELKTPIAYTDLIYRDNGIDTPLSDVLMNIEVNNWSMEEQLMTPYDNGNPTSIPATIKAQYGMDAVEAIDTLQKTCYFADDVKANLQALLTCINTNCAETLGGTFAISETATDKVLAFSFTPNVEPTNEGE